MDIEETFLKLNKYLKSMETQQRIDAIKALTEVYKLTSDSAILEKIKKLSELLN